MGGIREEKEWEIRRLAAKYLHQLLTEAGNAEDAKMVAVLVLAIFLNPVEIPAQETAAELVKLHVVGSR